MERYVMLSVEVVVKHDLAELSNLLLNKPLCLTLINYAMRTPPFSQVVTPGQHKCGCVFSNPARVCIIFRTKFVVKQPASRRILLRSGADCVQ